MLIFVLCVMKDRPDPELDVSYVLADLGELEVYIDLRSEWMDGDGSVMHGGVSIERISCVWPKVGLELPTMLLPGRTARKGDPRLRRRCPRC